MDARDARNQEARTDCTGIRSVVGAQINRQPAIEARLAVPLQRIEILAHRIEGSVPRYRLDRATDIALRRLDVFALEPGARFGFVFWFRGDQSRLCLQPLIPMAATCG